MARIDLASLLKKTWKNNGNNLCISILNTNGKSEANFNNLA